MSCDFTQLKKIMMEVISDETGVAGVPIVVAERRMQERIEVAGLQCGLSQIRGVIQRALDDWEINKTPDELAYSKMKELGMTVCSGFTWHLKILRPEVKALIQLLREQNDPDNLGVMPIDLAAKKLVEQGFSEDDTKRLYAQDIIEDFGTSWGDSRVWCYGLVPEYKKTEEYKQWQKEIEDEFDRKQARRERMVEECEITGPIHGYLDDLAEKREVELMELLMKEDKMDEQEYLLKKAVIESRDEEAEKQWNEIIEAVFSLNFSDLIELREIFLGKPLPSLDEVHEQLRKMEEKKGA
jgi:hypothetical protein